MDVKIEEVIGSDRDLLVIALQALHRERVTAFHVACTTCDLAGIPSPDREQFGLAEVTSMLRRVSAAPL